MVPQPSSEPPGAPSIVLFVDDDSDTLDMYAAYFEMSGLWVAKSTTPADALSRVAELRPDLVVTDMGFAGRQAGIDFVSRLKTDDDTRGIPIIVLTGRGLEQVPAVTRSQADLCLVKPVLPDALLMDVQRLIALSHTLRDRCARARESAAAKGGVAEAPTPRRARAEQRDRPCPGCQGTLEWIERGRVAGADYDYYRWCAQGCGLYCFDCAAGKWVRLV